MQDFKLLYSYFLYIAFKCYHDANKEIQVFYVDVHFMSHLVKLSSCFRNLDGDLVSCWDIKGILKPHFKFSLKFSLKF